MGSGFEASVDFASRPYITKRNTKVSIGWLGCLYVPRDYPWSETAVRSLTHVGVQVGRCAFPRQKIVCNCTPNIFCLDFIGGGFVKVVLVMR